MKTWLKIHQEILRIELLSRINATDIKYLIQTLTFTSFVNKKIIYRIFWMKDQKAQKVASDLVLPQASINLSQHCKQIIWRFNKLSTKEIKLEQQRHSKVKQEFVQLTEKHWLENNPKRHKKNRWVNCWKKT